MAGMWGKRQPAGSKGAVVWGHSLPLMCLGTSAQRQPPELLDPHLNHPVHSASAVAPMVALAAAARTPQLSPGTHPFSSQHIFSIVPG